MSWLKSSSFRSSITRHRGSPPAKEFDPSACYDSFKKHWQQAFEIIERTQEKCVTKQDDVLIVVNHIDQMISLLLLEFRSEFKDSPCLEYLLSEDLLECIYDWSLITGRFNNSLKLEQFKLYESLMSHSRNELLIHESFLRPLLRLLSSCVDQCFSVEAEKRLVALLNLLCVSFMQQSELIELFFPSLQEPSQNRFVIFSLLIPFIHREGPIGQQARDALLLCMSLSKHNDSVESFITNESNVCPVLATGLSGLYSRLPRKLSIEAEDWHRFTPDDVAEIKELTTFINSLEFCNVVVQISHPKVQNALLEFLYQGFLVPVLGPALLQDCVGLPGYNSQLHANIEEDLIVATAYFDLMLRSVTHPGLLHSLVRFTLQETYEGHRVIDALVTRINAESRLCLVTLATLESLVDLNCEDIMLDLVLRHLVPCTHVMLSQRSRVQHIDPYCRSAQKFLSLSPAITRYSRAEGSLYGDYRSYLSHARDRITSCTNATQSWTYPYDGESPPQIAVVPKSEELKSTLETDADHISLPSADDGSSGYESFKTFKDNNRLGEPEDTGGGGGDDAESLPSPCGSDSVMETCHTSNNVKQSNSTNSKTYLNNILSTTPSIGLFLDILFAKLESMLSHDLYVNLHLTGLVSRLAVYPQPLIHSFLLDHSLVFQPSIRSLFQVIGTLKQRIETKLSHESNLESLTQEAQLFLLHEEDRIVNARRNALNESPASLPPTKYSNDSFDRGDNKRRSLSTAFNAMFRRYSNSYKDSLKESELEPSEAGYWFFKRKNCEVKRVVMCGVLLDEWLKELAAITQEHAIAKS
ncbi:FHIP family protein GF15501 isoform X2 [Bemisia tabaci]|uniref:FHIP family protein GF15501 isoform X2 n=1 Tax=Bemisia tabaci TaxID=7038 RepID=UPI0008F9AFD6|nr:PREDICTED: UPF0518 protein GF15501 isoform X2 [Bemisia tabaci]